MSISIHFKNHQKNIYFDQIPELDVPMRALIAKLHREGPPPQALTALADRASDLSKTTPLLNNAKNHIVRDKVFALLSTATIIGLIVAIVFGFIANPFIGVSMMGLTLGYLLFCHIKATALSQKEGRASEEFLAMPPFGVLKSPFILSYLLLTRASSLQTAADSYKREIQSLTPEAFQYWSLNSQKLATKIATEERRAAKTLLAMQKLPIRSLQGEKDLAAYKDLLAETQIEVEKGRQMAIC